MMIRRVDVKDGNVDDGRVIVKINPLHHKDVGAGS